MIFSLIIISGIISGYHCACVYPSNLIGEWYSTSFGTLQFTTESFSGFKSPISSVPLTFTCYMTSGSRYVSSTTHNLFTNINVEVYLCMNLQRLSDIKYVYTLDSDKDAGTGVRFYTSPDGTAEVTINDVCTYTDTRSDGEYELLIKTDQINNAMIDCPSSLQTTYDVTITTNTISDCNGTQLVGNGGVLVYNYSTCVAGVFNNGGILQCIYSKSNTYITLYNNDTSIDGTTTFKFTCLTYRKTADKLEATEYPSACLTGQTPTSVESPGITYSMTDRFYTPPGEDKDNKDNNTVTIIIIVFCILAAIIIIGIIIIILYLKVFKKPRPPTPPKIRKRRRKPSVTEYTPRILGRVPSIEKIDETPCKVSTGELISGVHSDKTYSNMNLESVSSYEPPQKEVWQKKWEKDLHPKTQTPRLTKDVLKNSNAVFPSLDAISKDKDTSVYELDKAFTMSTSLPESLDYYSTISGSRQCSREMKGVGGFSSETINTDITDLPKYSERSHATSKIPESTGKFGGPSTMPSFESVIMPAVDSRLDTITENPLSRENTTTSMTQKDNRLKKLQQNLLRMRNADVSVRSTPVAASDGTASGWQYKWETVLRPKSAPPDTRRVRKCKSPAKLFQNCDKVKKESKWKLLKAKIQNRFKNKIEHIDDTNPEPEMEKTTSEHTSIQVTECETCEEGAKAAEKEPTETKYETILDEIGTAVRNKEMHRKRKDSLELLRENVHRLHCVESVDFNQNMCSNSNEELRDSPRPASESIDSLNEDVQCDVRISINEIDAVNEVDKIDNEANDVSDLFVKSDTNSIVKPIEAEHVIGDVRDFKDLIKKPKDVGMLKETLFDTVSIHTELFYPDEWIYESCIGLDELWDLCSKTTASMRRRQYKQYMKYPVEEESIVKKDKRKRERHTFKVLDEQGNDWAK